MKVKIEVIEGVEGWCLAINDRRVCGPKPWGGGKVIKKWDAGLSEIFTALPIMESAPETILSKESESIGTQISESELRPIMKLIAPSKYQSGCTDCGE